MENIIYILLIILSYLYGSIPFALIIGKKFYNTDVREKGSGNLGGTNAGRVLGKTAGLSVIILDASKCCISILIAKFIAEWFSLSPDIIYPCALACVIGHCYPIFAEFRGGKAVSVFFGYVLVTRFYAFAIIGIAFLIILKIFKYVSLSSIMSALLLLVISPFLHYTEIAMVTNCFIAFLLIFKHSENIKRLIHHEESKITWM